MEKKVKVLSTHGQMKTLNIRITAFVQPDPVARLSDDEIADRRSAACDRRAVDRGTTDQRASSGAMAVGSSKRWRPDFKWGR